MAKKTFYNGKWRLLQDNGSGLVSPGLFDKGCDPPIEGKDEVWEADGIEWRRKVVLTTAPGVCPRCGKTGQPTATKGVWYCENMHNFKVAGDDEMLAAETRRAWDEKVQKLADPPPPGTKEYMVVSQRDEWFLGKFSPERLEQRLNILARDGWRVVVATTSDVGTWFGSFAGGARQEMVILMERTVGEGGAFSKDELRQISDDRSVP